jgi:L-threonylcarbamoyladenylate synthase
MALSLLRECQKLGVHGLAAPSANRFGRISPTSAAHVRSEFDDGLLVLDGGDCDVGIESVIVDCTRGIPVLLRPGMLTIKQLEAACDQRVYLPKDALQAISDKALPSIGLPAAPRASGTLASHYAPRAKLRLVSITEANALQATSDKALLRVYALPSSPAQAAHELFAKLRELDHAGVQEICVTQPPSGQAWDGVRDRLTRAAV